MMKSFPKILAWTSALMVVFSPAVALAATGGGGTVFNAVYSPAMTGFKISLELANVAIVIAIIVIAFGTMLKRENLSLQHILPRLILVAIGINFSWLVATAVISLSNKIAFALLFSFVHELHWGDPLAVAGSVGKIIGAAVFGGLFNNPSLPSTSSGIVVAGAQVFNGALSIVVGSIMGLVFSLLMAVLLVFALVATIIMYIIRYVALEVLLAVMPIAIIGLIFPHVELVSGLWTKWKAQFWKWVIFYPTSMFFVGLALAIMIHGPPSGTIAGTGQIIFELIIVGLMIAGLLTADKMGVKGAGLANMAGIWAAKKAAGVMGRPLKRAGEFAGQKLGARATRLQTLAGDLKTRAGDWKTEAEEARTKADNIRAKAGITPTLLQIHELGIASGGPGALTPNQISALDRSIKLDQKAGGLEKDVASTEKEAKRTERSAKISGVSGKAAEIAGKPFVMAGEKGMKMGLGLPAFRTGKMTPEQKEENAKKWKKTGKKFGKKSLKELGSVFGDLESGPMGDLFGKSKEEKLKDGVGKLQEAYKETGEKQLKSMESIRTAIEAANPGKKLAQYMEEYRRARPEVRQRMAETVIKKTFIDTHGTEEGGKKYKEWGMLDNVMFGINRKTATLNEKIAEEISGIGDLMKEATKVASEAAGGKKH